MYCQDIQDPDTMDQNFIDAWAKALGAEICIPLTGDKKLANMALQRGEPSHYLGQSQ